jgi:threonine aldolase
MEIDLRSDTVTRPTEAMLEAMRKAELGDDGREGDPTVRAFEAKAAATTGKEAAMYVPSGTMGNLVALLAHTGRGSEVILEASAHILRSEIGGIASLASLFHRAIPGKRGAMDLEALKETISPGLAPNRAGTALICMETTHNAAGGAVLPLPHMATVHAMGQERGIPVHTDGARIFNAAVALGVPASKIAAHTDSLNFCISKGLSAPIGSVLAGTKEFIDRARLFRRMVGGNLRQGGVIAAAGIVALDEMVDRLAEDHATAKRLADGLFKIEPSLIDPTLCDTNIVYVDLAASARAAADWSAELAKHNVMVAPASRTKLRFVTHRHISMADIEHTIGAFSATWQLFGPARAAAE